MDTKGMCQEGRGEVSLVGPLAWYVISALLAMLRANPKKIKVSNGLEK